MSTWSTQKTKYWNAMVTPCCSDGDPTLHIRGWPVLRQALRSDEHMVNAQVNTLVNPKVNSAVNAIVNSRCTIANLWSCVNQYRFMNT